MFVFIKFRYVPERVLIHIYPAMHNIVIIVCTPLAAATIGAIIENITEFN